MRKIIHCYYYLIQIVNGRLAFCFCLGNRTNQDVATDDDDKEYTTINRKHQDWKRLSKLMGRILIVIDVCTDIYVTMSSDLYGTCSSADVIVMSRTNSNLPYGTQCGCNCNPFGNIATLTRHRLQYL